MKITATRYEDLQKARQEYDDETKRMSDIINEQEREYRHKLREQESDVEKKVADMIGATTLQLQINVDPYPRYGTKGNWTIRVTANEHTKFEDNVALSWNWEVSTDSEGNIVKDSGSWSGLKVTTPEQIADLEESVRVIKILNNANWEELLNSPHADYSEFIDKGISSDLRDRRNARPNFEQDMLDARLEDLIGKNVAIKLKGDEYFNGNVGIVLTGMSDKFLKGYVFPWRAVNSGEPLTMEMIQKYAYNEARRVGKNKVMTQDGLPIEVEVQG